MQPAEFNELLHTNPSFALAKVDQLYVDKELPLKDAISSLCDFVLSQGKNSVYRRDALLALTRFVSATSADELILHEATLLPALITSLDANIPDVSTALRLLWVNDCLCAEHALRQCGLAHSDSDVRLASITELSKWIEYVNGRFAFRRFTPYFVDLLRDPDSAVRAAAYTQIISFFKTAKLPAKQDLQKCMQKADINIDLQEKILRIIGLNPATGTELLQAPPHSVQHSVQQQPSSRPSSRMQQAPSQLEKQELATNSSRQIRPNSAPSVKSCASSPLTSPSKVRASSPTSSPNRSYMDKAMKFEIMNTKMYAIQPLSVNFTVSSSAELDEFIENSLPKFEGKEMDTNWDVRLKLLQKLRSALHYADWLTGFELRDVMRRVSTPLIDVLGSMRTVLVAEAIYLIKETAQIHSETADKYYNDTFDGFFEPLARLAGGVKKITSSLAHIAVCSLLISGNTVSNRVFQVICMECKSIKGFQQVHALYWLKLVVLTSYSRRNGLADRLQSIAQIIISCLTGADKSTRSAARGLFWDIRRLWPEANQIITAAVNPNVVKLMETENMKKPVSRIPLRKPASLACMTTPRQGPDSQTRRSETPVPRVERVAFSPSRPKTSLGLRPESVPMHSTSSTSSAKSANSSPYSALGNSANSANSANPSPANAANAAPDVQNVNGEAENEIQVPSRISSNLNTDFGYGNTISLPSSMVPSDFPVEVPSHLPISGRSERSTPTKNSPANLSAPVNAPGNAPVNATSPSPSASSPSNSSHSSNTSKSMHNYNPSNSFIASSRPPSKHSSLNQSIADLSMDDIDAESDSMSKEVLLNAARNDLPALLRKIAVQNLETEKLRLIFDTLETCNSGLQYLISSPNVFITEEEIEGSKRLAQAYYTCQSPVKRGDFKTEILRISPSSPQNYMLTDLNENDENEVNEFNEINEINEINENLENDENNENNGDNSVMAIDDQVNVEAEEPVSFTELPTTEPECVEYFTKLLHHLETHSATNSELVALTVLTTAQTTCQNIANIELPISVWTEKYSSLLPNLVVPFVLTITNETVMFNALVLLKAVLKWSTEITANEMYSVIGKCAAMSLSPAVKKVFLPELTSALLKQNPQHNSKEFSRLITADNTTNDTMLYLQVRILAQACTLNGPECLNKCSSILQTAISHEDVNIRKQVYPLLMRVHEFGEPELFQQVKERMSEGQQRLLEYYLHNQPI